MVNPDEWVPAAGIVEVYGTEGSMELTSRGFLEWRGDETDVRVPRTRIDGGAIIHSCPGSEARIIPAKPSTPPQASDAWMDGKALVGRFGFVLRELDASGRIEWRGGAPIRGPGFGQWALPEGVEGRLRPAVVNLEVKVDPVAAVQGFLGALEWAAVRAEALAVEYERFPGTDNGARETVLREFAADLREAKAEAEANGGMKSISDVAWSAEKTARQAVELAGAWEKGADPWIGRIADLRRFASEVRSARSRLVAGQKATLEALMGAQFQSVPSSAMPGSAAAPDAYLMDAPALTVAELAEMRRRVEATTKGTWTDVWGDRDGEVNIDGARSGYASTDADRLFMTAAHQDVPRLLDEVERISGLLRAEERKVRPMMTLDAGTGAIFPMPSEDAITPGQRAVLEAADEWERGREPAAVLNDGKEPLDHLPRLRSFTSAREQEGRLVQAARALRESPAVVRVDPKVVETLKARLREVAPMPVGAGIPYADWAQRTMGIPVEVDPSTPPDVAELRSGSQVIRVTGIGAGDDALAEALFVAYNEQGPNPWKTWDGKDVPRWQELSDQVREKWRAVARATAGGVTEEQQAETAFWGPSMRPPAARELARVLDRIRGRAITGLRYARGERVHVTTTPEEALREIDDMIEAVIGQAALAEKASAASGSER